ncbi:MAG: putative MFS-type transporter YhjX [Pseudomonas citronellolis]|nr:MAG: putative MFS-type transporter YhjX [Pseudomonas citronellolis]
MANLNPGPAAPATFTTAGGESRPALAREFSPAALGVLVASVVAIMFGPTGILLNTFSLFIAPMSDDYGWDRAQVSLLVTFFGLAVAVTSPLKGWAIDRWGARRVMLVLTAALSVPLIGLALVQAVWQLYALFLLVGLLAPGNLPYGRILGLWYRRRLGMAYGLLGLGFGIGGPVGLFIGHQSLELWGWRGTYVAYGLLELGVALPLLAWLFRERPATPAPEAAPAPPVHGLSARQAWRGVSFWLVLLNQVLAVFVMSGVMTHGVPMLVERGLGRGEASAALSALWVGMMLSQPLMGWMMDRFATPRVALPFALLAVAGMAWFQHGGGGLALWLAVFMIGLGGGGESGTTKYLVMRYFGLRRFSVIYGSIQPFTFAVSISFGAWLLGWLYDRVGNYWLAEWVLSLAFAVAALSLLAFRPYPPPAER